MRVMMLGWTTNSKMMKSESRGLKSRTLRRSKRLSNSLKERNSISRITSNKEISSSNVIVAGEDVLLAIRVVTIKFGVRAIERRTTNRGTRSPTSNILFKQETG